jgi:PAS domain S-box-containing protein
MDWSWDRFDPLERHVAELLVQGKSNAAICAEVFLSRARVQECIKRILLKTGAESSRAAIALLARERESQSFLAILDQARAGVVVLQDRVVKFANGSARDVWGYGADEIEGMPLIELVAPKSRSLVARQYELRAKGEPFSQSYWIDILCKGGEKKSVSIASAGQIQFKGKPAILAVVTAHS